MSFPHRVPAFPVTIVGAGLAGQLLARALARRGCAVRLIHDPNRLGASRVAAWMINPVTGIRFVPSWRVDALLPAAVALYRELEAESGLRIWHPLPIRRFFQGDDEIPRWEKKRRLPEVQRYVAAEHADGVTFHSGGWADLGPWLEHHLEHPTKNIEIVAQSVDRAVLEKSAETGSRTIFCTGYMPSTLPWKPAKGELLTVRIPGWELREIWLRGIFVIPLRDEIFRVGATYEWDDLSPEFTEAGLKFLTEKLTALVRRPFEILDAQTAVRPILQDARPVLGIEPGDPRFGLCNGFGSKAALQAPAITAQFANHLLDGTPLDPEVSLTRLPNFSLAL